MAVPPVPVRVPSQRPFVPSVTSVANDKDDNEIIPEAFHRSPGIRLTAEENSGKLQLGDSDMKGRATGHRLKWGPFPPNEVDRVAQYIRERDERKEGKDEERFSIALLLYMKSWPKKL